MKEKRNSVMSSHFEGPLTTTAELWAWWSYEWASHMFSCVSLLLLFPFIIQDMVENVAYLPNGVPCPKEKTDECIVNFLGIELKTVSYTFFFTALSIASQALIFISLGAMADYGTWRKKLFMISTWLGCFFSTMALFVRDSRLFWVMSLIQGLCNMLYGTALVFYNSFLPILVDHHPRMVEHLSKTGNDPDSPEAIKLSEELSNHISTRGYGLGYTGGVTFLLITLGVLTFIKNDPGMMRIFIAISGLWWFAFSLYSMKGLKSRPGPKLPDGETNYIFFSWKKIIRSFKHCRYLPNNFLFLVSYLIYADAYSTICTVAIIFGKTHLGMDSKECVYVATITPICALIGVFFFRYVQRFFKATTKTMLISIIILLSFIPLYGIIGIFTTKMGLHHKNELYALGAYYGLMLGAIQSFSRVLYSELIPPGYESEFFSIYQITDKGGSWIGPTFVAILTDIPGGDIRYGFIFLLGMFVVALPLLLRVDINKGKADALEYSKKEMDM